MNEDYDLGLQEKHINNLEMALASASAQDSWLSVEQIGNNWCTGLPYDAIRIIVDDMIKDGSAESKEIEFVKKYRLL